MKRLLTGGVALLATATALAQGNPPCPNPPVVITNCPEARHVNISGATLLRGLFDSLAHINDFVDVDNDGICGRDVERIPQVDTLGNASFPFTGGYWVVQNRAVGSVNGYAEFIRYQVCGDVPDYLTTDISAINGNRFSQAGGVPVAGGSTTDNDQDGCNHGINRADGTPNLAGTGTPVVPCSVDLAVLDVPAPWGTVGPAGTSAWNLKPLQPGYGVYYTTSKALPVGCPVPGPVTPALVTLGASCGSRQLTLTPGTADSLYDTVFTSAPVSLIVNRGTGLQNVRATDLQHLYVTGRMPNGENYAAGTRDAGSGTRNAWCNSLGIDPAWGNGDNRGGETDSSSRTNLGSCHRMTNCGSSSHMQNGVRQRRIGVGYSGIAGSSATAREAQDGFYEIGNVMNDHVGGTQYVRPTVRSIVLNGDVNTGWRISGPASFVTIGDPRVSAPASQSPGPCVCPGTSEYSYDAGSPVFMDNTDAADYLYNLVESIRCFSDDPTAAVNDRMPGQFLARTFFLFDALERVQSQGDPSDFPPRTVSSPVNTDLQTFVLNNNNFDAPNLAADPVNNIVTPAFGAINEAGQVPNRGSAYSYRDNGGNAATIAAGQRLSIRNRVAFDFEYDGARTTGDIAPAIAALIAGAANYTEAGAPLPTPGGMSDNPALTNNDQNGNNTIIVDIIGDLDGNGVFNAEDIRYYADGFVTSTVGLGVAPVLNRCVGFTAVDSAYAGGIAGRPAGNFFNTSVIRPDGNPATAYNAGASRFDVTGSTIGPAKGDAPIGANGTVDSADYAYVIANFGDWSDLDQAAFIDLSADMNGDLKVDGSDLLGFWCAWNSPIGDLNFDGSVGLTDLSVLLANFGSAAAPTAVQSGNLNGDDTIGLTDLSILLANFGSATVNCGCN